MKEGNIEVIGNQLKINYYEGEQKKGLLIGIEDLAKLLGYTNNQKEKCYKTNEDCKHNCQGLCKESM